MECPACGLVNPDGTERCDCGHDLRLPAGPKSRGNALQWGHIEWGVILLLCAVALWIYERVTLRTAVHLQDVGLVGQGILVSLVCNLMLVVGSLYVIVKRRTFRRKPRLWAAVLVGLWGTFRLFMWYLVLIVK
jgi:hypothetical protein